MSADCCAVKSPQTVTPWNAAPKPVGSPRASSRRPLRLALLGAGAILLAFYLVQAAGMQSATAPFDFFRRQWFFILPLVLIFAAELYQLQAIVELTHTLHGVGLAASSAGVSTGAMFACCLHNLVPLFPLLGVSGLSVFFAVYQTQVFLVSIVFALIGLIILTLRCQRLSRELAAVAIADVPQTR